MTAAELEFSQASSMPSWLTLADNVFNEQAKRWDTSSCDGGLRWQIRPRNSGLKMPLPIGELFQSSARLARYTGNQTYADLADKIWDWNADTLLDIKDWILADAAKVHSDCEDRSMLSWPHNYSVYFSGAAYIYKRMINTSTRKKNNDADKCQETKWESGLDGLRNRTFHMLFPEKYGGMIMSEACEHGTLCPQRWTGWCQS
ncbi:hydrolase family 76 protein [Aspergillus sp. HF37]|nr:hydrolase family 76 protein [Aspergillus sp. HF37]